MTAPGERLTPQQMREEWERAAERLSDRPFARELVEDVFDKALAAWQADRDALEAASQKAQLYDEFPWGEIARDAHGFPVTAEDWETVKASHRNLEALLRRAREALREDQHDADTTYKIAAGTDVRSLAARIKHRTEQVLAELDAAQGEETR